MNERGLKLFCQLSFHRFIMRGGGIVKAKKTTGRMMWQRSIAMLGIMLLILAWVTSFMFYHTIIDADALREQAQNQQLTDVEIQAKRGNIYDKNMNLLATSATVWQVVIRPSAVKDKDDKKESEIIAAGISEILELTYEEVLKYCQKDVAYQRVGKKIESTKAEKIREFINEKGLSHCLELEETSKRYYPNDNLASTVLGFVGTDNNGLEGLEAEYDEQLSGENGRIVSARDSVGGEMPFAYEKVIDAKQGNSVVTTIDEYIQYVVEKYLAQAVEQNDVKERGCCIVMDVNTGGILAMANKSDFNPNDPFTIYDTKKLEEIEKITDETERKKAKTQAQYAQWRNKCVSDTYEPGSVFKIITGSAALEENIISTAETYFCPGYIKIADRKISCHEENGHGTQTLAEAYMNSCNPAFITIGQKLGVKLFTQYRKSFGLDNLTGIDLPGESSPIVHSAKNMGVVELASESFGQSFSITPIQFITAISAAVNGGYLYQPHIAKQIIDSDGNIVENLEHEAKRQVVSEDTSKLIREYLEKVVSDGTGKNAYVAGFKVGGKTGTSEKLTSDGQSGRIASFGAIAPSDKPQIAVLMLLDEPQVYNPFGGRLAAPMVGKILEEILPYLEVSPEYTEEEAKRLAIKTPNVIGLSIEDAKVQTDKSGLSAKVIGNGEKVLRQVPESGAEIPHNGTVILYTDDTEEEISATVPDFMGMTMSQANSEAKDAGLNIQFSGATSNSIAYNQSIAAGTQVDRGTVITVEFRQDSAVE